MEATVAQIANSKAGKTTPVKLVLFQTNICLNHSQLYQTTISDMFHYIYFKSKKVIILGDSLLNGINEKSLSKKHNVKIVNKPGGRANVCY